MLMALLVLRSGLFSIPNQWEGSRHSRLARSRAQAHPRVFTYSPFARIRSNSPTRLRSCSPCSGVKGQEGRCSTVASSRAIGPAAPSSLPSSVIRTAYISPVFVEHQYRKVGIRFLLFFLLDLGVPSPA